MSKENSRTQQCSKDHGCGRSHWIRIVDVVAVHVHGVLLASLLLRIGTAAQDTSSWLVFAFALLPGYLFADFASGLVHWFCDTFFEEKTPLLGKLLIQPFREHHRDPQAMTRHGFFELNGNNCLAMIPLLFFAWWVEGPTAGSTLSLFAHSFLFTVALAIFATNQFHRWVHAEKVPRVVRSMQRARLILSPTSHDLHHRDDYSQAYCITTGWMNYFLDHIEFFHRLEQGIRAKQRSTIKTSSTPTD